MARARNIKPGFFKNEKLADVDPLGRILFSGLWCLADREGRLEDRPKRIKAELLPYDDCDVEQLLRDLQRAEFIIRYTVDGEAYIQIVNFLKHQNPHKKEAASEIPTPETPTATTIPIKASESPGNSGTNTGKPETCPGNSGTSPADSFNLIPDSFNSDSLNLKTETVDSNESTPAGADKPVTNRDLIAELTEELRSVEGVKRLKGDYAFIGALYNEFGYDQVFMAINRLRMALATQDISKPLIYLRGILSNSRTTNARGPTSTKVPRAYASLDEWAESKEREGVLNDTG